MKITLALLTFIPSKLTYIMQITIKRLSAPRKDDQLVILINRDNQLPTKLFSKEELTFIRRELRAEKKTISVNQYRRMVYIQVLNDVTKPEHLRLELARKAGCTTIGKTNLAKHESLVIHSLIANELTLAFGEGLILGNYQFLKYRSAKKKEQNALKELLFTGTELSDRELEILKITTYAVQQTRDLVNEPQSFLTATELSKQLSRLAKEGGFTVQVLEKEQIIELKMGGLLAVNQGSIEPPTFTIMEHKPADAINKKPYLLVGKGVVYDTGGMSLKPTANSMDYMKCDMAGGAAVGGIMYAISKAKLPIYVVALVPATDNRPDGNAYVPGDVVAMMSGKMVEVLNTDAEGRMILADALHYGKRYKPELTVEFSTLTGAASAAIGPYGIVAMGTANEEQKKALSTAGNKVYERLAEFPFWDEYDDMIKSDVADIKNTGGASGGAITAGKFLAHFVDSPFMHMDIAGPAFSKSNDSYRGKNGTGVGVRLMFEFFKNICDNK